MRDRLTNAMRGRDADYIEVRIEEGEASRLLFRGQELEDVARTVSMGGCVRALAKGGWGFASFNDLSSLEDMIGLATVDAINKLIGQKDGFLTILKENIETVISETDNNIVSEIDKKLEELQLLLHTLNMKLAIDIMLT